MVALTILPSVCWGAAVHDQTCTNTITSECLNEGWTASFCQPQEQSLTIFFFSYGWDIFSLFLFTRLLPKMSVSEHIHLKCVFLVPIHTHTHTSLLTHTLTPLLIYNRYKIKDAISKFHSRMKWLKPFIADCQAWHWRLHSKMLPGSDKQHAAAPEYHVETSFAHKKWDQSKTPNSRLLQSQAARQSVTERKTLVRSVNHIWGGQEKSKLNTKKQNPSMHLFSSTYPGCSRPSSHQQNSVFLHFK